MRVGRRFRVEQRENGEALCGRDNSRGWCSCVISATYRRMGLWRKALYSRRAMKRIKHFVRVLRTDLIRFIQKLNCSTLLVLPNDRRAVLSILRGGMETQGWLSLKVSWMEDRRKRRPVS